MINYGNFKFILTSADDNPIWLIISDVLVFFVFVVSGIFYFVSTNINSENRDNKIDDGALT